MKRTIEIIDNRIRCLNLSLNIGYQGADFYSSLEERIAELEELKEDILLEIKNGEQ